MRIFSLYAFESEMLIWNTRSPRRITFIQALTFINPIWTVPVYVATTAAKCMGVMGCGSAYRLYLQEESLEPTLVPTGVISARAVPAAATAAAAAGVAGHGAGWVSAAATAGTALNVQNYNQIGIVYKAVFISIISIR